MVLLQLQLQLQRVFQTFLSFIHSKGYATIGAKVLQHLKQGTSRTPPVHRRESQSAACQSVRSRAPCHCLLYCAPRTAAMAHPRKRSQSGKTSRMNKELLEESAYRAVCPLRQAGAMQENVKLS